MVNGVLFSASRLSAGCLSARYAETLTDTERAEVAAFVAASPAACYLQDPAWTDHAPRGKRFSYGWCLVRDPGGALVAAGLIRRSRLAAGYWAGAFRRGPVTAVPADLGPVLACLDPVLKARGCVGYSLNPRWCDSEADAAGAALAAHGARRLPPARQTLHRETGLIALDRPLEEIRAGWNQSARRQLRKLEALGITAEPSFTPETGDLLEAWLPRLGARRGFSLAGQPSGRDLVAHARARGGISAVVRQGDRTIGVFTVLRDGDRLLFMPPGWEDPDFDFPRTTLIVDHVARRAAEGAFPGIRWFDFGGLTPEAEAADPAAEARDRAKLRFRPRRVRLLEMHEVALRPRLWALAERVRSAARRSGGG